VHRVDNNIFHKEEKDMTNTTNYQVTVNGFVVGVEVITPKQMDRLRNDQDIRVKAYSDKFFESAMDEYNNTLINALIKTA
jgi:hypothetical protein